MYVGGHYPSGTSCKTIYHYAQMIEAGRFQEYDYGSEELNMAAYSKPTPPEIILERIKQLELPVLLYTFIDDELSGP